ncbi:MAG: response regulator [Bacteroidetes bacterium]|nr:response regulator [Bacteroidota bacterium]
MTKTILVVEDDLNMQENIASLLEEEGYNSLTANNGLKAIEVLENQKVDLILSDVMMPKLDGFGLFEYIQKRSDMQTIPFILLTAKVDVLSLRKGMNLGVDDYLTKPFKADDLLGAVKVRLEKKDNFKKEIDKLRQNIVKYVPHELRTPLVSILGYSDYLTKEYDDLGKEEALEMITSINQSGARLFERLEKFLVLAEYEVMESDSDAARENKNHVYLLDEQKALRNLVYAPEISARFQDITATLQYANISIAENNFQLILKEIVSNACKFSKEGTRIFIDGRIKKGSYTLRVLDNGLGISKEEIKELGAFHQFKREKYQQVGNGLGLFLVQKLLMIADGSLSIISSGNRTMVKVKLPLFINKNIKNEVQPG